MQHNLKKPSIASYSKVALKGNHDKHIHQRAFSMLIGAWAIFEHAVSSSLAELMGITDQHIAEISIGSMDFRNKLTKLQALCKYRNISKSKRLKLEKLISESEVPRDIRNKICHLPLAGSDTYDSDVFYLLPLRSLSKFTTDRIQAYKMSYEDLTQCKLFAIYATRALAEIFPQEQPE